MDPRIAQTAPYAAVMPEALRALPSLSIAALNDDLFGTSRGIYANPERNGIAWERPISGRRSSPGSTSTSGRLLLG